MHEITALQAELEATDARRAELEFALKEARVAGRQALAAQVRDLILDAGFAVDDIVPLVAAKPAKQRNICDGKRYALKGAPGLVYGRGRAPEWLKIAMEAVGMDPANKVDRAKFRDQHMQMV